MAKVVVVQFPGVNCEYETVRALKAAGLDAEILRWNGSIEALKSAPAIVLPGGFSYQDRIRAGVVAAKDRIIDEVCTAVERGVPVLGICNGAQILVESGIVPGFSEGAISLALSPNRMPDRTGYFCTWIRMKKGPAESVFTTCFDSWHEDGGTLPSPIAHAEGRFITSFEEIDGKLARGEGVALYYACIDGKPAETFPENPNGSIYSIAGVTNRRGNVLALMPHPERGTWLHQVPIGIGGYWAGKRCESAAEPYAPGPGRGIFSSLKDAIA
jgi:phosphoribosylformylglycinamidine synthase I